MTDEGTQSVPSEPRATPERPLPRRGRWRAVLLALLAAVALLFGLLTYALGTQAGLRQGLSLLDRLAPGMLHLESVEGRLLGPLRLEGVALRLGELAIDIEEAELIWSPHRLLDATLAIRRLALEGVSVRLAPAAAPDTAPLALPELRLPLAIEVEEARLADLRLLAAGSETPLLALDSAQLAGRLHRGELALSALALELSQPVALGLNAQGQGRLVGDYPLDLGLDWTLSLAPDVELGGIGRLSGDLRRLDIEQRLSGMLAASLQGELRNLLERPAWQARLELDALESGALSSLLNTTVPALEPHLELESAGSLEAANLSLKLALASPERPDLGEARVALAAVWDGARLAIESLRLDEAHSGAQLEAAGGLELLPTLGEGRLEARWSGLRWPLAGAAPLARSQRGTLSLSGGPDALDYRLSAALEVSPAPPLELSLDGQASLDGELVIRRLAFSAGPNQGQASGRIGEQLALEFALDAPELARLWPEARGRLKLSGQLEGARLEPAIRFEVKGDSLEFGELSLAGLRGQGKIEAREGGAFELSLLGERFASGARVWERLSLEGRGTREAHRLEARLSGAPLTLALDARGGLDAQGLYAGALERLDLDNAILGVWRLRRETPLRWSAPALTLGPLCLDGPAASGGCLSVAQSAPGRWSAELDWPRLDAELLAPWLPESLALEGYARLRGDLEGGLDRLKGSLRAELADAAVGVSLARGRTIRVELAGARLEVDAAERGLVARLALPLGELGDLAGEASLPGWTPAVAPANQALSGRLRAELRTLEALAALAPDLAEVQGRLEADLRLAGQLSAPELSGEARLLDAGFEVPLVGLKVRALTLEARAPTSRRLSLEGAAEVGGARLDLIGEGRLAPAPELRLSVRGRRLKVADTSEYRLLISPDLELVLAAGATQVRGEIGVPEALIRPRSLPAGTVSPSPDVVLREGGARDAATLDLDLGLVLGDEVRLDAFGVSGRLAGQLRLLQEPGRELLGDGQLQILDGQYRFSGGFGLAAEIGVPLTIEQGRLIYAKSPIGNPGLLLQAQREGGDTTAGVRVLGTLRDPKLAFFSESDPGMSSAEITKYLLTGMAPGDKDQMGETGLAVGTYLAPRIYMEYESGLGDESNRVRLRYDLSPHIEIQTETGDSQGADIFFTIER
ncbi:MAG: translocation/assembly module TamB domain-containing protein [Chromatiaceae bacterium]|nr:translocation/assembly module TamB domain-containing protein [Chromatiaceae bacterium]